MVPLGTTVLLMYRAKRDDLRCKQRYGAAWDRYRNRVKYHIIPKVYWPLWSAHWEAQPWQVRCSVV